VRPTRNTPNALCVALLGRSSQIRWGLIVVARNTDHGLLLAKITDEHKWDYTYSVGQFHPDVVAQLFKPVPADFALLRAAGYQEQCVRVEHVTHNLWVRRAGTRIRWHALRAARCGI
jgi:hypothetical protein